jgi:basic membrane protein A
MRRFLTFLLALCAAVGLTGCGGNTAAPASSAQQEAAAKPVRLYRVCNLVSGTLGKGQTILDDAEAGLEQLRSDGRADLTNIEMGDSQKGQSTWQSTLETASAGNYDLIVCGTSRMSRALSAGAAKYPAQKYLIYDAACPDGCTNAAGLTFRAVDLGYLAGVLAAAMTTSKDAEKVNARHVIGFLGTQEGGTMDEYLWGYLSGAQSVDSKIQVDTRYPTATRGVQATAAAMIAESGCDVLWSVTGGDTAKAAQAVLESGCAWLIGGGSDQEKALPSNLAAVTLTSAVKEPGAALLWFFDRMDEGDTAWGQTVSLGISQGCVGLTSGGNYSRCVPESVRKTVAEAEKAIQSGKTEIPAFSESGVASLRESVRP